MQEWDNQMGLKTTGIALNYVTELTYNSGLPHDGLYIFVLRTSDDKLLVRISDRPKDKGEYFRGNPNCNYPENPTANGESPMFVRHTQLNGGYSNVWSAGQLEIKDRRVIWVSNASGHFAPSLDSLKYVTQVLVAYNLASDNSIRLRDNSWRGSATIPNSCE
jgi:hypothetical protein